MLDAAMHGLTNHFYGSPVLQVKLEEQAAAKFDAVFPCILRILPNCVFNTKDPIVVGVDIEEGIAKVRNAAQGCCLLPAAW